MHIDSVYGDASGSLESAQAAPGFNDTLATQVFEDGQVKGFGTYIRFSVSCNIVMQTLTIMRCLSTALLNINFYLFLVVFYIIQY